MEKKKLKRSKYWLSAEGVQTFGIAFLAAIAMGFALSFTSNIMIPFVLSLFLYIVLSPVKVFFKNKLRFPNTLALLATFAVVFILLTLVFFILFSAIQEFAVGYKAYEAKAIYFTDTVQKWLVLKGVPLESLNISTAFKNLPFAQLVKGAGYSALSLITTTFLVFIFLIFLFTGGSPKTRALNFESRVGKEINAQIRKYLAIKFLTSALTALLVFVVYTALDLDLAFLFAFLVFILNFIPTVGSMIATLLPLPVAFFQYDAMTPVLLVLFIPGAIQFAIGNILEPKVMGQGLNLHPVTVLMSLMFWSLIWGVVGAFLAVPITAMIKIIIVKIEGGKIIAKMMAGNLDVETLEDS